MPYLFESLRNFSNFDWRNTKSMFTKANECTTKARQKIGALVEAGDLSQNSQSSDNLYQIQGAEIELHPLHYIASSECKFYSRTLYEFFDVA